jgi:hypothetical protein
LAFTFRPAFSCFGSVVFDGLALTEMKIADMGTRSECKPRPFRVSKVFVSVDFARRDAGL